MQSLVHSRPAPGTSFPTPANLAANQSDVIWLVAEEVPVAFEYNRRAHAVMMATPADLEDFALGFSLCEGILASRGDVDDIRVRHAADGIVLSVACDPLKLLKGSLRQRSMEGRSGCGLCGVDSLANVLRPPRPVTASFVPDAGAVAVAFARLAEHQPMNRANRSLHAAAWCDPSGRIRMAREDVGRHNALDKLAGALAAGEHDMSAGFAVLSSRCSFELVQKAAAVGIPFLATVSAPTGLALTLARKAGMTLAARAPRDGVMLFR